MKEMPVSKKLAAHESGHPDQGDGPAPLPGTNRVERLMHSGKNLPPDFGYFGKRLVKKEWDEAEKWMKSNIDDKRP